MCYYERHMAYSRRKSIVLNGAANQRVYRTYADWQAEQMLDERSPMERGLQVGSPVMWRHMHKNVIVTDRAIVMAIAEDTLTVKVKDVTERTCTIHVREVVNNRMDDRLSLHEMNRNSYLRNQLETDRPTQSVML